MPLISRTPSPIVGYDDLGQAVRDLDSDDSQVTNGLQNPRASRIQSAPASIDESRPTFPPPPPLTVARKEEKRRRRRRTEIELLLAEHSHWEGCTPPPPSPTRPPPQWQRDVWDSTPKANPVTPECRDRLELVYEDTEEVLIDLPWNIEGNSETSDSEVDFYGFDSPEDDFEELPSRSSIELVTDTPPVDTTSTGRAVLEHIAPDVATESVIRLELTQSSPRREESNLGLPCVLETPRIRDRSDAISVTPVGRPFFTGAPAPRFIRWNEVNIPQEIHDVLEAVLRNNVRTAANPEEVTDRLFEDITDGFAEVREQLAQEDYLLADDDFHEQIPDVSPPLLHDPIVFPMSEEVKQHRAKCVIAVSAHDDDVKDVDVDTIPFREVNGILEDALANKKKLQESIGYLTVYDGDSARLIGQALAAKEGFVRFIAQLRKVIKDKELSEADDTAGVSRDSDTSRSFNEERNALTSIQEFKQVRVEADFGPTIDDLDGLSEKLEVLCEETPTDDQATLERDAIFKSLAKKREDLHKEATALAFEAADARMKEQAETLNLHILKLKKSFIRADDQLSQWKIDSGITSVSGSAKTTDLKPPLFSGENNGDLDYFAWHTDYKEYALHSKGTKQDKLRVLKKTCLTGLAQTTCKDKETEEDVLNFLRQHYGNPRVLLKQKMDKFRKLGKCHGNATQRREWYVRAVDQVEYLLKLAKDHEIENFLYASSLNKEILDALPYKPKEKFKERMADLQVLDQADLFQHTINQLRMSMADANFEVDFEITLGEAADITAKPAAKSSPKRTRKAGGYHTTAQGNGSKQATSTGGSGNRPRPKQGNPSFPKEVACKLCSGKHTHAFYCEEFQKTLVKSRGALLRTAAVCHRCLRLDSGVDFNDRWGWWKKHEANCLTDWNCKEGGCAKRDIRRQYHFTMCYEHISKNKENGPDFLKSLDTRLVQSSTKFFFAQQFYQLDTVQYGPAPEHPPGDVLEDVNEPAIFMLQHVATPEGRELMILYDTGCSQAAISEEAYRCLETTNMRPGPTKMGVAGGQTISIPGGDERFWLDTTDGKKAAITAIRMPEITSKFQEYDLKEAYDEIQKEHALVTNGRSFVRPYIPKVPEKVGGRAVDIIIGIRYNLYWPEVKFHLPSGLTLYESRFKSPGGLTGILGGPHKSWREVHRRGHHMSMKCFFTQELRAYQHTCKTLTNTMKTFVAEDLAEPYNDWADLDGETTPEEIPATLLPQGNTSDGKARDHGKFPVMTTPGNILVEGDTSYLTLSAEDLDDFGCDSRHCQKHSEQGCWTIPAHWNITESMLNIKTESQEFSAFDDLGTELSYRCLRCRNCNDCRKGELLEKTSLQEETEQALIESKVAFNAKAGRLEASLPFIKDPQTHLKRNYHIAVKMLERQVRSLARSPEARASVIKSHDKLLDKGHVVAEKDLSPKIQKLLRSTDDIAVFIPWNTVTKEASLSTPVRVVFNASSRCATGESLNSCLAKGQNKLPKILHMLLRFASKRHCFAADISMAYNAVKLLPEFYTFQRYLWKKGLEESDEIVEMIITTLIYGVAPAGPLMGAGFEDLANYASKHHPLHEAGAEVLREDTYVDDSGKAADTMEECEQIAASLDFILKLASMSVKEFVFSGKTPTDAVSPDGKTIGHLGYTWWPVEDVYAVAVKDLCFGKVVRGKYPPKVEGSVREALKKFFNRRVITGKVCGLYDPRGFTTPVSAGLKCSLSAIVDLKLGWDDPIPETYLEGWVKNLETLQAVRDLKFDRSFIDQEAISSDIELIVSADASQTRAVAAVHARTLKRDGTYGCHLVMAKSKLVHLSTIPRGELKAAVLGATLAHIVKANLGDQVKRVIFVVDSIIVLYWLNQDHRPLQTAVRNSVIEIRRLSCTTQWFHTDSVNNVADIGTREVSVEEISEDSEWIQGRPWMSLPFDQMPLKTLAEKEMDAQEKQLAKKEMKAGDICGITLTTLISKVGDRYAYSKYLVDPCVMDWPKSVRILAYVKKFIDNLKVARTRATLKSTTAELNRQKSTSTSCSVETVTEENAPGVLCELRPEATEFFPATKKKLKPKKVINQTPEAPRRPGGFPPLPDSLAQSLKDYQLSGDEIAQAEKYFFKKATREVKHFSRFADWKKCSTEKDGILYYSSRILDGQEIDDVENVMDDLEPLSFVRPMADRYSPVAYAIMVHSHQQLSRHRNSAATLLQSRAVAYIIKGRDLADEIREACIYCRRYKAKLLETEMSKVHPARLTIAPAFFRCQVDMFGPYDALCEHNCRAVVSVWGLIFKDPASHAIAVYACPKSDTGEIIRAYTRHAFRYGHPAKLFIDGGSQLVKACKEMQISWTDLTTTLNSTYGVGVEHEICPPLAHNQHGMVERSVLEIKRLFHQVFKGVRLDIFAYETAFQFCANELNSLPICLGSRTDNLSSLDLITPNRLLLGRNNRRAPVGYGRIETQRFRQIEHLDSMQKSWWKVWKDEKLADYIPKPAKWQNTTRTPEVDDIVIFLRRDKESTLGDTLWRIGRIVKLLRSKSDDVAYNVVIQYKNHTQSQFRETERNVRSIAILYREGDLELVDTLNQASKADSETLFLLGMRSGEFRSGEEVTSYEEGLLNEHDWPDSPH